MRVERVDFVGIPARDLERARTFYKDVLELPQNPHDSDEFEAGNVTLAVWDPTQFGLEFKDNGEADIALRVADVAAARVELEAKGVEFFGEIKDTGVCHMSFFQDTEGNSLMLHHRYAPPDE